MLSKLQAGLVGRKLKLKIKTTSLSHARSSSASHNTHISLTESSILLRSIGWACIFLNMLNCERSCCWFRLLSSHSNSWSAIDLELLYQTVINAIGNWKKATITLLPIHILKHTLSKDGTISLSLKRQLVLFRTSLPDCPVLSNDSPLSVWWGTLDKKNLSLILQK